MCNLLLKALPAWGQSRWLRALSSWVLKASKNGNFTALLAACSTAWASSWGKQFSLHSVWISLVQFTPAVSDPSTNFSEESRSAFWSLYCYRAFSSPWRVCIAPYWTSYGSCWHFNLSESFWMAGLPSSCTQIVPGDWCHQKTWQKHAPSPHPGHW